MIQPKTNQPYPKKMKSSYVIEFLTDDGGYATGINRQHLCVTGTLIRQEAKQFKTEAGAKKWATDHSDAGYGLNTGKWKVVPTYPIAL